MRLKCKVYDCFPGSDTALSRCIPAIARIDRMGQTRPTEVYCYYAEETVEKNILDLASKRGQSLYTKDNSAGTLSVNPLATTQVSKTQVDSPSKKAPLKGDFVFK